MSEKSEIRDCWNNRPNSYLVKWLMNNSKRDFKITPEYLANCLGTIETYMNNKIYRDSFSIKDMLIVSHMCGYKMAFLSESDDDRYDINLDQYFKEKDSEVLDRLKKIEEKKYSDKLEEYYILEEKLKHMKEELNI